MVKDARAERSSNIELFRIISMLVIVAHHYVVNSGLLSCIGEQTTLGIKDYLLLLYGWGGKTGINCFVLITGYYLCESRISFKKYIKLFAEVEFYSITIFLLFAVTGYQQFSIKEFAKAVFPFFNISDGFTSCFLLFYLLVPYLNKLLHAITEKEHVGLIAWCMFVYTLLPSFARANVAFNYITWFCVIYIFAAYMRMYPKQWNNDKKKVTFLLVMSLLLSWISVVGLAFFTHKMGMNIGESTFFVSDSNKILALTTAIFAFMFFKNLNLRYHKAINVIAASTFGVLQIHTSSDTMRRWLWQTVCNNVEVYNTRYLIPHAIFCVAVIYAVCTLIDGVRIRTLEIPFMNWIDKWMKNSKLFREEQHSATKENRIS